MVETDELREALAAEGIKATVMCVPEAGVDGLHVELDPGVQLAWVPLKAAGRTKDSAVAIAGIIARHMRALREAAGLDPAPLADLVVRAREALGCVRRSVSNLTKQAAAIEAALAVASEVEQ